MEALLSAVWQQAVSMASSLSSHLRKSVGSSSPSDWIKKANKADLSRLSSEIRSARNHDDYEWILTHRAAVLDPIHDLLAEGSNLLNRNGTLTADEANELRDAYAQLRRKRREALQPILQQIEQTLPFVEGRLRQFPIDTSLLAYGFMTLVGFVWLCGYYTALGVEVVPLLRDIRDVFLIGATSGLMPVALFAGLTAAAFYPFRKLRHLARLDTATSAQLLMAFQQARLLRSFSYWSWRCVMGLLIVANVSVLAGLYSQAHSTYDIAVIGESSREEPIRVLGSIGGFLVTAPAEGIDPSEITIVPVDDVKCLRRGAGSGACTRLEEDPGDDAGQDPNDLAITISTALAVLREKDEWHTLVERVGQCRPVRTTNPGYLVSPVFGDDSAELTSTTKDSFVRSIENDLLRMVRAATEGTGSGASINIIGFASGTSYPARNSQLASQRARTIADAIRGIPALSSCKISPPADGKAGARAATCPIDIRAWGYGELPPLNWIGKQGDPSERIVLIAACREDIR